MIRTQLDASQSYTRIVLWGLRSLEVLTCLGCLGAPNGAIPQAPPKSKWNHDGFKVDIFAFGTMIWEAAGFIRMVAVTRGLLQP